MTKQEELRARTKKFALRVIRLTQALPRTREADVLGKQLLRSGTSVGANYRAVCRARSRAEFVARIGVVVEEADESVFWLELIMESGLLKLELNSRFAGRSKAVDRNLHRGKTNREEREQGLKLRMGMAQITRSRNYPITKSTQR